MSSSHVISSVYYLLHALDIIEMNTSMYQISSRFCPNGTEPLESQVAGHTFEPGTNSVGLLKDTHDAIVLKPIGKPDCGAREIRFYESVENSRELDIVALKKLVPKYFGTVKMQINERELEFLKLEDLTFGISEPCIMDIKVGKRTWDPLATPEKRFAEEQKYAACKESLGLCIPGFQVYDLFTGKLQRFGKDYGKALNETTFKDALKYYLNAKVGLCRTLVFQFLRQLEGIQNWSQTQTSVKLYSSSILLIYDAKRLKNYFGKNGANCNNCNSLMALEVDNTPSKISTSVEISPSPDEKLPTNNMAYNTVHEGIKITRGGCVCVKDNVVRGTEESTSWVRARMIDFAHAFFSDDNSIDTNYLFGIESLIKIFKLLLEESD